MNHTTMELHIKKAISTLVPDLSKQIWNTPVEKATGTEWYLDGLPKARNKTKTTLRIFSSLAACLALCLVSFLWVDM
ncbi:MAG: hypothetical protein PHP50_11430 [Lachnospiraceae bacterium]|nr:hypothetical protein [Lachnospiraceae bacterium]